MSEHDTKQDHPVPEVIEARDIRALEFLQRLLDSSANDCAAKALRAFGDKREGLQHEAQTLVTYSGLVGRTVAKWRKAQ